ncbi:MAG: PD-(D/E)XK nuclease family protein [Pseudomonadota bacterium]
MSGTVNPINLNCSNAEHAPPWWRLPYGDDALSFLAQRIVARCRGRLPDLHRVAVITPHTSLTSGIRQALLTALQAQGAPPAFVGLPIASLRNFINTYGTVVSNTITPAAHELLLVEALRPHPALFNHGNPWAIAADLLQLFEQLTLHNSELPAQYADFVDQLRAAYGKATNTHDGLEREAALIHTLWRAAHTQLAAAQLLDSNTAYLLQLTQFLQQADNPWLCFILPDPHWSRAEQQWVEMLAQQGRAEIILLGQAQDSAPPTAKKLALWERLLGAAPGADNAYEAFWESAFAPLSAPPLHARAHQFANQFPTSPVQDRVRLSAAPNAELEARTIELQIRMWRGKGLQRLCVITDDRQLARRVRALLERSGIAINDYSGWALSTTRAAALIERWLECIENDFEHGALLDVLHSPLILSKLTRDAWQAAAYRLDRDIIRRENIHNGLDRYRHHLKLRLQRVAQESSAPYKDIETVLDTLQSAAAPLHTLLRKPRGAMLRQFIQAILSSLKLLGAYDALENDAAGARVLEEIRAWSLDNESSALNLTWQEFRTLLGRTIERYNFIPAHVPHGVTLLNLAQSLYQRFDAVIMGGLTLDKLPGIPAQPSFFNQRVRRELGLPAITTHHGQRLYLFRQVLSCAPAILFTWSQGQAGDTVQSPWLECIDAFHHQTYGTRLLTSTLAAWALLPDSDVCMRAPIPPPLEQPRPILPPLLQPQRYSARSHQHLIDCPYQFFARHGLRLERPESVRDAMSKADQGELIHRCLQAFHHAQAGLPGPWRGDYQTASKPAATALLLHITEKIYGDAVEDNFEHRGWLTAWRNAIPLYIDWQWQRAQDWHVNAIELKVKRALLPACEIDGRIDRIDKNATGLAIVDYKTGTIPSASDIVSGEAIQLIHYVLTQTDPTQVRRAEYLHIESANVSSQRVLTGDDLETCAQHATTRLCDMHQALAANAALPAWGDPHTCARCDLQGVCRRVQWA